jgi:hypothetical protein
MHHAAGALKLAIDLLHLPTQVRSVRSAPLPVDVRVLLRIAAGDEEVISQAVESAGRSRDVVREAAAFFIEQILLYPGADSYRVLGSTSEAPYRELRHNMALLLRWLHPDSDRQEQRVVFAARVTRAWNDLKTNERRVAYDQLQRLSTTKGSVFHKGLGASIQSSKHRPAKGWNYSEPHHGDAVSFRPRRPYSDNLRERLRRILLQLFGRSAL